MTTSTQTQLRRGTNTQVLAMTPVVGEAVVDTTNSRLCVGDGATAGGIPQATSVDVQKQKFTYNTAGGSANAITVANVPAIGSLVAGLRQTIKAASANTSGVTFAPDSLTAKNVYKILDGSLVALVANDMISGGIYDMEYDGTQWQLLNPNLAKASSSVFGLAKVDGTTITASGGVLSAAGNIWTAGAVGSPVIATQSSGGTVSAGGTTAGSNLSAIVFTTGGVLGGGAGFSGTWQAAQTVTNGQGTIWQRTV